MTYEEMERTMQFILEQQAQLIVNSQRTEEGFQRIQAEREKDSARTTRLEESFRLLVELVGSHDDRLISLSEAQIRISELLAESQTRSNELAEAQTRLSERLAESQTRLSEKLADTDERLNSLIAVVERYISSRGQNGSSQN